MLIGDALRRSARNHPEKLAVKDEYGKYFPLGTSLSYGDLYRKVNRFGNSLIRIGFNKGDRVAVQTGTGLGYFLSLLALAKAGLVIAPIDRSFTPEEIAYQVIDSGSRGIIVDADLYQEKIEPLRVRLDKVEFFITIGKNRLGDFDFETLIDQGEEIEPNINIAETDIATLIYTSGTTGRPKGAPLTHRNWTFSATVWAAELGIHPYTRWLLLMPMHTSGGTGLSIASVTRGCSLVLSNPDPAKILRIISKERISFTQFSPTLLANIIRHPEAKKTDFSSLEHWFTSAAPISEELLKEGTSYLGEKFIQLYGTTETALLGTVLRPQDVSLTGPLSKRLTSIGKACLGYQTKVIDDRGDEIVGEGEGELCLKGEAVSEGYWNKPEATDFRNGWWHSGDIVRVDRNGFYYVIDRKKDMIISGGLNVYPREVEDVLASHPTVHLVSVIGIPDKKWGEAVKAVIVLKEGHQATSDEILEYCKHRLAPYKKPKSVDFIPLSEMPVTGGGYKVLKRVLRDRFRRQEEGEKAWGAV